MPIIGLLYEERDSQRGQPDGNQIDSCRGCRDGGKKKQGDGNHQEKHVNSGVETHGNLHGKPFLLMGYRP